MYIYDRKVSLRYKKGSPFAKIEDFYILGHRQMVFSLNWAQILIKTQYILYIHVFVMPYIPNTCTFMAEKCL